MKKSNVILIMVGFILFIATSCIKDNEVENSIDKKIDKNSIAQLLHHFKTKTNVGNFSGVYVMASQVGHSSSTCGGKCTFSNGTWYHRDCQGFGSECGFKASINIVKNNPEDRLDTNYTAYGLNDYEPIEDSTYNMPARSFYFQDIDLDKGFIYINIPEQLLLRDRNSKQFVYNKITFSDKPLFVNF